MTQILIDGRPLQGDSAVRGIGSYLRGLLQGFAAIGSKNDVELLLRPAGVLPPEVHELRLTVSPRRIPQLSRRWQPLLDPWLLPPLLLRRHPDLYHAVEWAQPLFGRTPVVVTVHDLTPFVFPHLFVWMRRKRLPALWQLRFADAVIADSQATATDVERIARVPAEKIHIVPLGVGREFAPAATTMQEATLARLRVHHPFILASATFDPHKRIGLLLDVFARMREKMDIDLVITGDQGGHLAAVQAAIAEKGLAKEVHLVGHLPKSDLINLYSAAAVFVHTSAYEGFGLPPLEAMACGSPVICFANSSLPEVCGEAAVLIADGDAEAMAAAAIEIATEPQKATVRRRAGIEQSARFTWETTARRTEEVYRQVLGRD